MDKTRHQFFGDKVDTLNDEVNIPGISQRYVLNKVLKKRPNANFMHQGSHASTSAMKHIPRKDAKFVKMFNKNVKNSQKIKLTSSCKCLC